MSSLYSESLVATTGLSPVRISRKDLRDARAYPARFAQRLKAWVNNEEQVKFRYEAVPKRLDEIRDKMVTDPTQAEVATWNHDIGTDDPELTYALFFQTIKAIRNYIAAYWPTYTIDEGAGPKILPLADDDAADVWSVYQVVADPMRLLDEFDSWLLTEAQAQAFRENYPELFAFADGIIDEAISRKRATNDDYSLGHERMAVLRTFRGLPPELVFIAPAPPVPEKPEIESVAEDLLTQGEASAKPK